MFTEKRIELPLTQDWRSSRRPQNLREFIILLAAFALAAQLYLTFSYRSMGEISVEDGANSTLGFGVIYAVSRQGSPRRQSLLGAANLTSLDIDVPVQPIWTEEQALRMRAPVNSTLDRGSALAWLGHLNVLETFLNSSSETALILEDDVDWDTRLRTSQIPQTAHAIRALVGSDAGYYGERNSWDIIWLGHCGDNFNASRGSTIDSIKSYTDSTMPSRNDLHHSTRQFMDGIGAEEEQQRLVHESIHPLCSFAYAVTRSAAERLLHDLAKQEPVRSLDHPCKAYDVRLLEGCRDEGLRCISVNPELFHHTGQVSEIEQISQYGKREELAKGQSSFTDTKTTNIRCSARSKKWQDLRDSIIDPTVSKDELLRDLAESSSTCYIDDL